MEVINHIILIFRKAQVHASGHRNAPARRKGEMNLVGIAGNSTGACVRLVCHNRKRYRRDRRLEGLCLRSLRMFGCNGNSKAFLLASASVSYSDVVPNVCNFIVESNKRIIRSRVVSIVCNAHSVQLRVVWEFLCVSLLWMVGGSVPTGIKQ